jgi:hypothetical protein
VLRSIILFFFLFYIHIKSIEFYNLVYLHNTQQHQTLFVNYSKHVLLSYFKTIENVRNVFNNITFHFFLSFYSIFFITNAIENNNKKAILGILREIDLFSLCRGLKRRTHKTRKYLPCFLSKWAPCGWALVKLICMKNRDKNFDA